MRIDFNTLKPPPENIEHTYTIAFIDYEYLFISFTKQYLIPPKLHEICDEIKRNGKLTKIYVFGDFTKPELSQERNHIRTITSNIIDCGSESIMIKKDFTDFIMLDHIYQELNENPAVEQFVLFTGDGHFSSSATFLKNFMDKTVGVYGLAGSLSRQLRDCSSWAKEMVVIDDDEHECQINLLKNIKKVVNRGMIPTFMNTVEHTIRIYGGDHYRYIQVLSSLIEQGYINNENRITFAGKDEFRMLAVDWERVNRELAVIA